MEVNVGNRGNFFRKYGVSVVNGGGIDDRLTKGLCALLIAALLIGDGAVFGEPAAAAPDFDRQIAPLLARRCLNCHNPDEHRGKLDLTRKDSALAGGESGAVIVPVKPDESLLWHHVESDEMPPKKPLPADEKALIKRGSRRAPLGEWILSIRFNGRPKPVPATTGGRCNLCAGRRFLSGTRSIPDNGNERPSIHSWRNRWRGINSLPPPRRIAEF